MTERLEIAIFRASTDVVHPIDAADRKIMDQIRTATAAGKGHVDREPFDAMMEQTPDRADITYEPGTVAGVRPIWCRPSAAPAGRAILYIHGGAYIAGSAAAFRHLAAQIAARAGAAAFVPDYRLAPEHRFPAAFDDAHAAFPGLFEAEARAVAVVGDSAGGGLARGVMRKTPVPRTLISRFISGKACRMFFRRRSAP